MDIKKDENTLIEKTPSKRGRKPSAKKKYYFGKEEEEAFNTYINSEDNDERELVFRKKLYPAFTKMVESIIRTYILFIPSEDFEETFHDTMSFLITKLSNFDPKSGKVTISYEVKNDKVIINDNEYIVEDEKVTIDGVDFEIKNNKLFIPYNVKDNRVIINDNEYIVEDEKVTIDGVEYKVNYYKLFSYCGTICKNRLMAKKNLCKKTKERLLSYDVLFPTADKDTRVDEQDNRIRMTFNNDLIDRTISQIQMMLIPENINRLTENEQLIGYALLEMLMNWEDIFKRLENKKFNKTSVWFFLKEYTRLSTKEIREGMRKYKNTYLFTKEKMLNE